MGRVGASPPEAVRSLFGSRVSPSSETIRCGERRAFRGPDAKRERSVGVKFVYQRSRRDGKLFKLDPL